MRKKRVLLIVIAVLLTTISIWQSLIPEKKEIDGQIYMILYGFTVLSILAAWMEPLISRVCMAFRPANVLRWLVRLVCAGMAGMVLLVGIYPYMPFVKRADGTEKMMLVLGAPVIDGVPTSNLISRADGAAEWIRKYQDTMVFISGGKGGPLTEAETMRNRIAEHGVSTERVYLETTATTTVENLILTRPMLEAAGWRSGEPLAITTSNFHCLRLSTLARENGYDNIRLNPVMTPLDAAPIRFFNDAILTLRHWLTGL